MFICEYFFIIYGEHFVHNLLCSVPWENGGEIMVKFQALCQMLGYSPYESSLAPIIFMVGAILFAQK